MKPTNIDTFEIEMLNIFIIMAKFCKAMHGVMLKSNLNRTI